MKSALQLTAIGSLALFSWFSTQALASHTSPTKTPEQEEVLVWGEHRSSSQAGYTNPTSLLLQEDMASINVATVEDVVKYEPSLVIRRRFIGDANGTMGMRGSNMFQTSRSMVFADGVPLHYFLQSRWSGAPRWTMVSASEIAKVEVIYGPFSAEYSGNAMGGVVIIETAIPREREFHLDGSYFSQKFSEYQFDDKVDGYKGFISYGDKIGDLSLYLSANRLENESQPQTFFYGSTPADPSQVPANPVAANGGTDGVTEIGNAALIYGDTGVIENTTDNFKIKLGYDFGNWRSLLNIAYEDRNALTDSPNPYLRNSAGDLIWSGNVTELGKTFKIADSRFAISELDRRSLSIGLRLKGDLNHRASLEANVSRFAILEDETRNSALNPQDPAHTSKSVGSITDFDDTGWHTADIKLSIADLGVAGLNFISGMRYETYELNIRGFSSSDYNSGRKDTKTSHSGGQTDLTAVFAQFNWDVNANWDMSLGGRLEFWNSRGGYYYANTESAAALQRNEVPSQTQDKFSPKFSLGYQPNSNWVLRYSLARAYRFPIVEELFTRHQDVRGGSVADPTLQPEDGVHQNFLAERNLADGYIRLNLFHEIIKNVVENQTDSTTSITTFFPIDEVETLGAEWIVNSENLFVEQLDVRFNLAYIDAEIVKNSANRLWEGKVPPRMPKWRGNLLATYHLSKDWDIGGSVQYASDSFGRPDNADTVDHVYGAQDAYARLGIKTNYRFNEQIKASFGVDNITDETAYVVHPWPGRTLYLTLAYDL